METKRDSLVKLIAVNSILVIGFSFIGGLSFNYIRHGKLYLDIPDDALTREASMRGNSEHIAPKWVGDNAPKRYEPNCFSLHPYFGFSDACVGKDKMGFTKESTLRDNQKQGSEKIFRVLVLGGSVASHLSKKTSLEKEIYILLSSQSNQNPRYRKSFVFNAALPGYKQPQQSLILASLLSAGFKFDAIVNVNGFNEIALPISENFSQGISLLIPRSHVDREAKEHEYLSWTKSTLPSARFASFVDGLFSVHPLYLYARSRVFNPLLKQERRILAGRIKESQPYRFNIPASEQEAFLQAKQIWMNSSLNAYILSNGHKIPYYEYVQPNQYQAGSKPLTVLEKKIAYKPGHPYGIAISKYYSQIQARDFMIPESNIWDARMIYNKNSSDIYVDDCCHMNPYGMNLMAKDIAKRLFITVIR